MNKIQSESDNIKISNLIRLSRKKRNKCLKKTHKSFMWGGSSSKPKKLKANHFCFCPINLPFHNFLLRCSGR